MKKVLFVLVILLLLLGIGFGCYFWYKSATKVEEEPKEVISTEPIFTLEDFPKTDASLAIHPLMDALASNFLGIPEEDLTFEYTKTRTSEVYRNLIDGKVDVIFAAEISKEDQQYADDKGVELEIIPATASGFVFIVNKENPVKGLTLAQIQDIYQGKITNWKEVGGEDAEIIPYQRPTGSGSQTAMLSLVMKDKKLMDAPTTQLIGEMGALVDAIASYDNAKSSLGYSYFYYVNTMYSKENIKMLEIDGVNPTKETIKDGTYPLFTNGFIVLRKNEAENSPARRWVEAVLSSRGSKIIEDNGYVPVN